MAKIVVGVDGSPASLQALERGLTQATLSQGTLDAVHVVDLAPAMLHLPKDVTVNTKELAAEASREVWEAADPLLRDTEVEVNRIGLMGTPGKALIDHCREVGADLLVVSTRGKGKVRGFLIGSTAKAVTADPPCDVLLVKPD